VLLAFPCPQPASSTMSPIFEFIESIALFLIDCIISQEDIISMEGPAESRVCYCNLGQVQVSIGVLYFAACSVSHVAYYFHILTFFRVV
jgi:hypothetical protein